MKWLCLLLFFSNLTFSQSNSDNIIKKNYVKEVRILDSKNNLASVSKYDTLGRLTFNALDDFGGATYLKTSIAWFYDESGNKIKTVLTHSSFSGSTVWFHEYDDRGNKISVKTQEGNLVFQFFYDNSDFLIKEMAYDGNTVRRIRVYEKFEDGKKIVSRSIKASNNSRITTSYFDDNGNSIKVESYDGDKINFSTNSTFEKNRLVKIVYNSGDGRSYYYDTDERLIKTQNFKIEKGVEILGNLEEYFTYNDRGLIETYTENLYSEGNLREYKYEYDFYK